MPTIGGLDEVGYGAWAGPIISCVAVFDEKTPELLPPGVTDSKKLTPEKRRELYLPLCKACVDIGIGHAWPWEIDSMGVHTALQLSYRRALGELSWRTAPHLLIVDGSNRVKDWGGKQQVEPKADLNHKQVSAASIIAKFMRDEMMKAYARDFPGYGWETNSGYGTKEHEDGIRERGLLVNESDRTKYLHRRIYTRKVMLRGA